MKVTFEHVHTCPSFGGRRGYCHKGTRALCEKYGINWTQILKDGGIEDEKLLATGDPLAIHLVEWARECENNGQ